MTRRLTFLSVAAVLAIGACSDQQDPSTTAPSEPEALVQSGGTVGVNIVLKTKPTAKILAELATYGTAVEAIPQINGVTLKATADKISAISKLAYVKKVARDVTVTGSPVDAVAATNFLNGLSTWDQDAINATVEPLSTPFRGVTQTGSGVYVGVLDTGLLSTWRQYFPQERIATQFAKSFGSGNSVPEQPNKWEHDVNGHGTHVTSTIIGYSLFGTPINGTAPLATIIPVKVLGQTGSGSSAAVARGIVYISELKIGPLAGSPVVINMSLGGPSPDPLTEAAIDLAVGRGVIIVASAGNSGPDGFMGWPGAFPKVISVASAGWIGEWRACAGSSDPFNWWILCDVPETNDANNFYISDFSSRESPDASLNQDLDVAAPGSWVVGPFQLQRGKIDYFFLGGTSMASPHVAGIVALMAQKRFEGGGTLTPAQAEAILTAPANVIALPAGCRTVAGPTGATTNVCWGADATGAGLTTADKALAGT